MVGLRVADRALELHLRPRGRRTSASRPDCRRTAPRAPASAAARSGRPPSARTSARRSLAAAPVAEARSPCARGRRARFETASRPPARRVTRPWPSAGRRPRQIGVMDVAREHGDRGRGGRRIARRRPSRADPRGARRNRRTPPSGRSRAPAAASRRSRAARAPQAPPASASPQRSRWCSPGASRKGSEVPISRCSKSPSRCSLEPLPFLLVEHRALALLEDPAEARVEHDQAHVAEVAAEAPPGAVANPALVVGDALEDLQAVVGLADAAEQLALAQQLRREVADELIEPVGGDAGALALGPPVGSRMSSTQAAEMFQSSLTSWSSTTIETETVE